MQENRDILLELENSNDFFEDLQKIQELNMVNQNINTITYNYEVIVTKNNIEEKNKNSIFS